MPLRTVVKVGNISNLSDARYCSGMGVDMLGFGVVAGMPTYLSPKLYQEIRGWISGPKIVAELYGMQAPHYLAEVLKEYAPDYFELTMEEYTRFSSHLTLPCIVNIPSSEAPKVSGDGPPIAWFQSETIRQIAGKPVLLKISSVDNLAEKVQSADVAGVALSGSPELRPGFKERYELADVLELLDE